MWDHLPIRLHGAIFDARFPLWPWDVVYWHWFLPDGGHLMERASSLELANFDPMASVMRHAWSWWTLTGRDEALRDGLYVDPWKLGDAWEHVGLLDADSIVPWPWPRSEYREQRAGLDPSVRWW